MRQNILLILITGAILMSCNQTLDHNSRQYEANFNIASLTGDEQQIEVGVRYFYIYHSDSTKYFDEKGYFANKEDSVSMIIEPIFYSATREVIQQYSRSALDSLETKVLNEGVFQASKRLLSGFSNDKNIQIQLNAVFLELNK